MQLSNKQKTFSQLLAAFPKTNSIFQHVQRKDDPSNLYISEIRNCEKSGYKIV